MQNRQLQKQTGAFFTPEPLARQLARAVLAGLPQNTPLKNLKILDPAAGEGGLLLPFAKELATLRAAQEPSCTTAEILQDILSRQLFAADINATCLAKLPLPPEHIYHGDSLQCAGGQSVLTSFAPGGFNIMLANPPYIGQKGHAPLFNALRQNPLWAPYVTPKNDLLYYFFYLALHVLKPGGIAGFLTPPYFATASGGKLLRQTLRKQANFLMLLSLEEKYKFSGVEQHTLLSVFQKGRTPVHCRVGQQPPQYMAQDQLFYGPDEFLRIRPQDRRTARLLKQMARAPYTLGKIAHVSNGLMTGCDRAFILTDTQKKSLPLTPAEQQKLKPFFKNSDIFPYTPRTAPRLWLIDFFYPNDRGLDIKKYPHLRAHLTQYKEKLLARKQNNNGIDKQLAQGKFWFASVRRKLNFEGEKLVLPQRARRVVAAYSGGPWYASSDVYFITSPKPPYTLWTILGLLNAAPYLTWLQAHGKRKGELLELYSAPLKQLPVPALSAARQKKLETLARALYATPTDTALQTHLDALVTACFDR